MNSSENIEIVWSQFSASLKKFILSRVKNSSDSEDILQNVFLRIHDNISNLKDKSKIRQWIYQITRNLINDYFREENRYQASDTFKSELSGTDSADRIMDEAINDMIEMMNGLSPEYREALQLTELKGMPQREYAEKTGLSYSGAKSRIQRARMMLKEQLLKCCHYQFDKYGTVFDIQSKCCCCPKEK